MGGRVIAHEGIGLPRHQARHVRVEVERGNNRHVRADDLTDLGEQMARSVIAAFGDHGPVHGHQHGVDRKRLLQPRQNLAGESLVGLVSDGLARGSR